MNDMTAVIVPKSDQINADDLIAGPRTIRITGVDIRPGTEQPVSIHFEGDEGKPWKPCKSMSRVLVAAWGPDAKAYAGRSVTLYRDPKVKWGGMEVGGIRVSHLSHIEREMVMALTATKGKRAPYTVRPLADAPAAAKAADDPAAKWAAAYLAMIRSTTDPAALKHFVDSKAARLEELRSKRPELAAEIDMALADASPADTSFEDDFDLDSTGPATGPTAEAPTSDDEAAPSSHQEGVPDEDRGEAFNTPDDDPRRATVATIVSATKMAGDAKKLAGVRDKHGADIEALPDDLRAEVDEAFRVAEQRVGGE